MNGSEKSRLILVPHMAARMLARDWRAGELRVLAGALLIAVAAFKRLEAVANLHGFLGCGFAPLKFEVGPLRATRFEVKRENPVAALNWVHAEARRKNRDAAMLLKAAKPLSFTDRP